MDEVGAGICQGSILTGLTSLALSGLTLTLACPNLSEFVFMVFDLTGLGSASWTVAEPPPSLWELEGREGTRRQHVYTFGSMVDKDR